MTLGGCAMISASMGMTPTVCSPVEHKATLTQSSCLPRKAIYPRIKSALGGYQDRSCRLAGRRFNTSVASASFLSGEHGSLSHTIPKLPCRRNRKLKSLRPTAIKDISANFRYPPMTKKPRWYWRVLACLPYLMPLHETWMYAETAYHIHPFLEHLEDLTYPFLESLGALPSWFLIAYFFVAYLGVVRRKEWPHFFRFHVVVGMLLEITLQVIGTVSRWIPEGLYWGKIGRHFWVAFSFGFLFTVMEAIRCVLTGMYADIPFVSDAAYIQIPYD